MILVMVALFLFGCGPKYPRSTPEEFGESVFRMMRDHDHDAFEQILPKEAPSLLRGLSERFRVFSDAYVVHRIQMIGVYALGDLEFTKFDFPKRRRELVLLGIELGTEVIREDVRLVSVESVQRGESFGDPYADITIVIEMEPIRIFNPHLETQVAKGKIHRITATFPEAIRRDGKWRMGIEELKWEVAVTRK